MRAPRRRAAAGAAAPRARAHPETRFGASLFASETVQLHMVDVSVDDAAQAAAGMSEDGPASAVSPPDTAVDDTKQDSLPVLPTTAELDAAALGLVRRLARAPFARSSTATDSALRNALHDHHTAICLHHRKRMRRDYGDYLELDGKRGREAGRDSRPARFSSLRRGGGGGRQSYANDDSDDEYNSVIHVGPEHQAVVPDCIDRPADVALSEREQQLLGSHLEQSDSVDVRRRAWTVAEASKIASELHRQPKESFLSVAKACVGMPPTHGVQCYYHFWKTHPQR